TGHGGGRVSLEDLMRDLNSFAESGKLPDNLPAASATAAPGGMKMRGMAEQKGVKHVIAVMSGKGGVGKSLVAGLLAVGLKRRGFRVGVLDGDITGPSIPKMFGVREKPPVAPDGQSLMPSFSRGAIPIMSMNLLLPDEGEAVIWRGPMVSGAIRQFFSDVQWGELDYLIVDLPPGTSDAPLTVMQALPVDGVVLVTTPQALAAMVVTKAAKLVKQLGGDILGIVEHMAYVRLPDGSTIEVVGPSQALQLVIARNHLLVLWSRLGRYDRADLDRLLWTDKALYETISFILPTSDRPLHEVRTRTIRRGFDPASRTGRMHKWIKKNDLLRRDVIARLRKHGSLPLTAFEDRATDSWTSSGWTSDRNVSQMLMLLLRLG